MLENRLVVEIGERAERGARQHDADAHQLAGDRNQPEPAEIVARDDPDVAGATAVRPRHARVVREDGDVCQPRLVDPQVELASEQRASTRSVDIAPARSVRAPQVLFVFCTVAVTPSASKAMSTMRCCSRTSAPHAAAWRSSNSSKAARGTCHVCGMSTPGADPKSRYRSKLPSAGRNVAPHFCVKPAPRTSSSAPIARSTSFTDARRDSPL